MEKVIESDTKIMTPGPTPIPCLVCERALESVIGERNQPYSACTFTSHGHYGCTVFDEMDGAMLEINVCDECLTKALKKRHVGYWPGHPRRTMKIWDGE